MTSLAREAYKLQAICQECGEFMGADHKPNCSRSKTEAAQPSPETPSGGVGAMLSTKPAWTAAADAMVKDLMQLPVPTFREIANLAATNGTGEPTVNERCIINLCEGAIRALKSIRTA